MCREEESRRTHKLELTRAGWQVANTHQRLRLRRRLAVPTHSMEGFHSQLQKVQVIGCVLRGADGDDAPTARHARLPCGPIPPPLRLQHRPAGGKVSGPSR